ncbi:uncharacterized protein LOC107493885 [Arachis duranensis]|uniref:ATP-dependent DNA helicase n=1 Tax=Arachis duranensis TaxID=130453 RepID=A0A6P4DLQ1_ARADU|nr:uncharacterized protein LOC107493885 [Arachis duranensis]
MGGLFFLYGQGGCEKHSYGQLYHAQLGLKEESPLTRLITKAKLIIWDETPMINKYCYEALDKCLTDILRSKGGIVLNVASSQIRIMLICHLEVLKLTKNMRLSLGENNNIQELRNFAEWLLKIGDGLAGDTTDGESIIHIPSDILIKNSETTLDDLIDFVYPDMLSNLSVENYFKDRAILAPTLDCVSDVNNKMTAGLPGQERVYLSSDSVYAEKENMKFELDAFSSEILNGINCSGLPPHKLVLKVGAPIMLL